jgi:hypothetical protein
MSGKVTPYVVEQNCWISSAVPGSWPRNWLLGKPMTEKPRSPYCFCRGHVDEQQRLAGVVAE